SSRSSSRRTARARGGRAAPGSACRSPGGSSSSMGDGSGSSRRSARGRRSPSRCPCGWSVRWRAADRGLRGSCPARTEARVGKRILVIEDHEENRRIMRDLLTHAAYEMLEAVTGEEGVTAALRERPDLILMDIQLPGMDGYEVTRRIRAEPALRAIPIIAVTSYALSG